MLTKDKINLASNNHKLYLFKEGMFYKLYNQNAMWFVNHIKSYKITVKFVKKVNQNVFTIGFPQNVLNTNTLQLNLKLEQDTTTYLCYKQTIVLEEQLYIKWCNTILTNQTRHQSHATTQNIMQLLKHFDVANNTPMQALEFVVKLKAML